MESTLPLSNPPFIRLLKTGDWLIISVKATIFVSVIKTNRDMRNFIKRAIGFIVIFIVIFALCGAEIIGAFGLGIVLALSVLIWKVCNISSAFPDDDDSA